MRRPGLWVANGDPGNVQQMLRWQPGALACFYDYLAPNGLFDYKAAHPDLPIIIRFQHPPLWHQDPGRTATQLGQQVVSKWSELAPLEPYVYFAHQLNMHYENGDPNPANQQLYTTPAFYQKYAHWVRLTADVIKQRVPEMKLVTPPFAFGFNEDGAPDSSGQPLQGWAGYDYLYETVRDYFDNILTFHAFWGYSAGGSVRDWLYEPELASWYAFRWQRILKLFQQRYGLAARLIVDQAGNFSPGDSDFTDQLIYYAQHTLSDARVLALTYFLWSDPTNNPLYRRNGWRGNVANLAQHLDRLQALPDIEVASPKSAQPADALPAVETVDPVDIPEISLDGILTEAEAAEVAPARTIRILFEDGHVETLPLEQYLEGVVPAEMPALWPEEALKVQAIAARTYAAYALAHPRHHPVADICTTTHCQHYDPSRKHARTAQAIQATQAIIILYQDQLANAVFSARCGGHTKNNEDVWKGRPVPYLRGVPCPDKGPQQGHGVGFCQHGARLMAEQGRTHVDIVAHYYRGTTLGTVPPR